MAEKKQGLFGSRLRQPLEGDGGRETADDPAGGPRPGETVEAYEEDWYRSLKALAAQRQQFVEAEEPEEEPETEAEVPAEERPAIEADASGAAESPIAPEPVVVLQAAEAPVAEAPPGESSSPATVEAPIAEPPAAEPSRSEPAVREPAQPVAEEPAQPVAEEPAPAATEPAAPVRAAEPVSAGPSLASPDPEERRRALALMTGRELSDDEVARVGAMVLDPNPGVRCLALEMLSDHVGSLDDDAVRRALQDPADEVRAVAVRLAAARGAQELPHLSPLIGARRWPQTQRTVLEVLPELVVSASPLSDEDLALILSAVGELDSPPQEWERGPFARLAPAIGVARLLDQLSLPDARRVGAARLLAGDESPAVLRAIASHLADPLEEMRMAAAAASQALARTEAAQQTETAHPATSEDQTERVASLVQAMHDPDEAVRHLARAGLAGVDRGTVLGWVKETIHSGDSQAAWVAVETAQLLALTEVAGGFLDRAAALDAEHRGPFVEALKSFGLQPGPLVALVSDVDEAHRAEAIRIAWELGGAPALPHLQAYLDDPAAASRMAVLEVMGDGAYAGAGEVAKRILETDLSAAVRAAAVRMVGRHGGEAWTFTISKALHDPDANVRMTAIEWLPGGMQGEATQILLQALSDGDERVRRAAVNRLASRSEGDRSLMWQALRSSGSKERGELTAAVEQVNPGVLTELAFESLRSLDEDERVLAVEVVGWGTTQACVEAAIHAMQDPSSAVRRTATTALARLRDPSAAGALGKALGDPDPEVRVGVVRALGVIDDESVLGFLVSALNDPDPRVRQVTSEVLTEWSSPAVAKRLAGVLAVPSLRDAAAELLLKMGPSAVELLIDVLRQGHPEVTATVGSLLQRIVGLDDFIAQTGSVDPDRRLRALEAVGAIGGPAATVTVLARLGDPAERVRIRSAQLLGSLGDPRAREALTLMAASDPVPDAATAAREALASLDAQSTAA